MKTRELILWLCIGALTVGYGIHARNVERLQTSTQDTALVCEDRDWRLRAEIRELKLQVAELAKFVGKQHPEAVDSMIWWLANSQMHCALANVGGKYEVTYHRADRCPLRDAGVDQSDKPSP